MQCEHAAAEAAFDLARLRVSSRIGTSPKEEYESLLRAADLSWQGVQRAREALDLHIRKHDCEEMSAEW